MNQEMFHAFGVIDASLELVHGGFVGNPADHGLLRSARRRWRASGRKIGRRETRHGAGLWWRRSEPITASERWRRRKSGYASVFVTVHTGGSGSNMVFVAVAVAVSVTVRRGRIRNGFRNRIRLAEERIHKGCRDRIHEEERIFNGYLDRNHYEKRIHYGDRGRW